MKKVEEKGMKWKLSKETLGKKRVKTH